MPVIASCIYRVTQCMVGGQQGSKNVLLIMPSGWTANCGVHGSQRCKLAKQSGRTGHITSDGGRGCCAGGTSVKSHEIDWEHGYENQSLFLSHERCPNNFLITLNY